MQNFGINIFYDSVSVYEWEVKFATFYVAIDIHSKYVSTFSFLLIVAIDVKFKFLLDLLCQEKWKINHFIIFNITCFKLEFARIWAA